MTVEQISVFVENRSGQLGDVTRVLEKANINIRALSLSDTTDFGVLRLMADDTEKAREALAGAGFTVGSTPVVAVDVADTPGGLGRVLGVLSEHQRDIKIFHDSAVKYRFKDQIVFHLDFFDVMSHYATS